MVRFQCIVPNSLRPVKKTAHAHRMGEVLLLVLPIFALAVIMGRTEHVSLQHMVQRRHQVSLALLQRCAIFGNEDVVGVRVAQA